MEQNVLYNMRLLQAVFFFHLNAIFLVKILQFF